MDQTEKAEYFNGTLIIEKDINQTNDLLGRQEKNVPGMEDLVKKFKQSHEVDSDLHSMIQKLKNATAV